MVFLELLTAFFDLFWGSILWKGLTFMIVLMIIPERRFGREIDALWRLSLSMSPVSLIVPEA